MVLGSLDNYLQSSQWQHRFDEEALQLGKSSKAKTQDITWETIPDGGCVILGKWKDRLNTHQPEITIWKEGESWQLETECDCEERYFCSHAVAILTRASQPHILDKLQRHGSLKGTGPASLPEETPTPSEYQEEFRLRASPKFRLHLLRRSHLPEVIGTYLKQKRPSQQQRESKVPIALANVVYSSDEHGDFTFPLLSGIRDGETKTTRGQPLIIERFRALEKDASAQLARCGLMSVASEHTWLARIEQKKPEWLQDTYECFFPDPSRVESQACWLDVRNAGVPLLKKHGWEVEISEDFGFEVDDCNPEVWRLELTPQTDGWFSLSVGFELRGKSFNLLPILTHLLKDNFMEETLDRPNNGTQYAVLGDGTALNLPIGRVRDILRHLTKFIDPKFPGGAKVHAIDAVQLMEEVEVANSTELEAYRQKLSRFDSTEAVTAPDGLRATLRGYQLTGLKWMQSLRELGLNGILADDMGLGKTLQSIAHIMLEIQSGRADDTDAPALVIAPTSVVTNWQREANKFAPQLTCLVLQGATRHRYYPSIPHSDIVLTSYALLHRDIEKLKSYRFHLTLLDEAQYIKTPSAKATQAALEIQSNHRLCLSGTPIENNLGEFWSLLRFLMPGLLGSKEKFNEHYRTPIENHGNEDRRSALKKRVESLILRRTKDEVAKELPPKTELIHRIELHTEQKDLYETIRATMDKKVRQAIAVRGLEASQMFFLSALLKLRQICCHPALLEDANLARQSAKLDFTLELIETLILEDRRILLFSQFTSMLDMISTELNKRGHHHIMLTGATKDRGALVDQFQAGDIPIFLISLKAGGTGLTLTAADTVIHYDPWWNPAVERQATDRAYRIGQDKPVFVHKLICQNTVEEKIHTLQQKKGDLADALLSDSNTLKLTPESLKNLLA